jgi:hypothetical protein
VFQSSTDHTTLAAPLHRQPGYVQKQGLAVAVAAVRRLDKKVFQIQAGTAAESLSADQFLQPGRIAQVGIDAGWPILQAVSSLVGFTAVINPGIWRQLAVLLAAFLVVVGSFFVLAIQLFARDLRQSSSALGSDSDRC